MPIDLTIFNGEENSPTPADPDATSAPVAPIAYKFATRQRGIIDFTAPEIPLDIQNNQEKYKNNLWAPFSNDPKGNAAIGTSNAYFNYDLVHSLGYLNQAFQPFITAASGRPAELYGDPSTRPFPWVPWFGRPYVSQLELMLVPSSHPARLLWEFQPCTSTTNNYNLAQSNPPFPQLLNFWQISNSPISPNLNQFGRILDYVGVPSWYAGTEIQADPVTASAPISAPGTHTFFPPYNRIPTYREPGRINLNTIYSPDVFSGLMYGVTSPTWFDLTQPSICQEPSRIWNILDILEMNPNSPSQFVNPFRSGGGVYWNPFTGASPEINATYLRQLDPATSQFRFLVPTIPHRPMM